jgi:hypothetical protein
MNVGKAGASQLENISGVAPEVKLGAISVNITLGWKVYDNDFRIINICFYATFSTHCKLKCLHFTFYYTLSIKPKPLCFAL